MKSFRKNVIAFLAIIAVFIMSIESFAQSIPPKPNPARVVNDYANILEQQQVKDLSRKLYDFWDSTSIQMIVVIVPTLGGYESSEYAVKLHREWGVGDAEKNNGIVMLVKPKTEEELGDAFISVGYGLEGDIPDAYAKHIMDLIMIPHFKNNDYYAAIDEGTTDLMRLAAGQESEAVKTAKKEQTRDGWLYSIGLIVLIIVGARIGAFSSDGSDGGSSSSSGGGRSFGGGSAGGGGAGGKW